MMGKRYRRLGVTSVAVMSVGAMLTLSACGVGRSSGRQPTCATAPGVTADQIEVGLVYPNTGGAASLFDAYRAGIDARLGKVNSEGGVYGRKVVYSWQDDAGDLNQNLAAAKALVNGDRAFGIMETTSAASGSAAFLHALGVPVTGVAIDASWSTYANMFSIATNATSKPSVSTWGDFIRAHGGRSALFVTATFNPASGPVASKLNESLLNSGIRVVGTLGVSPGVLNPQAIAARVKGSGVDTLIGVADAESFYQIIVASRAAGAALKVALSVPPAYAENMLAKYRSGISGAYSYLDLAPFELRTEAHRAFLTAMAAYAPSLQPANQGPALQSWTTADLFLRGLRAAGPCPTRQRFVTGLRAVPDYTAGGLLPEPMDFTKSFGHMNRCWFFVQVSPDGTRFQPVPPVPRCGHTLPAN